MVKCGCKEEDVLKAYIMVEAAVGMAPDIVVALRALHEVRTADRLIGVHDAIVLVEVADLRALGGLLEDRVSVIPGVTRTLTCVVTTR